MSKRIGEALVEKKLLSEDQLERAIKAQLIFGGHLGTCLIELGYIDESQLGETLSELFRVEYAPAELLQDLPTGIVGAIPIALVEKHRVVPLRVDGKTLEIAMIDPKNLDALDEIAFATGCRVVPWVAPEIRILQAMEKYYDIERRSRYITICRELDRKISNPSASHERDRVAAEDGQAPAMPDFVAAPADDHGQFEEEPAYGKSWRDVLEEACEEASEAVPTTVGEIPSVADLGDASRLLVRAETKEELGRAALAYMSLGIPRNVLFGVSSTRASVWDADCLGRPAEAFEHASFPVLSGTIFELLLGNDHYRGPIPEIERHVWMYRTLGLDPPREILMAPVHVNDRLVAILYGDGGPDGSVPEDISDLLRLRAKVSLAINLLLLKRKIFAI